MARIGNLISKAFKQLDLDGNGSISREEFLHVFDTHVPRGESQTGEYSSKQYSSAL